MTRVEERLAGLSPDKRRLLRARLAQQRRAAPGAGIERTGQPRAPLTFAQERLWFLEQLAPGNPVYNNPSALDVAGELDVDALQQALACVVRRHEALRTRFVVEGDQAVQVVVDADAPGGAVPLGVEDLRALAPEARATRLHDLLVRAAEDPFDLSAGPPMRALLVQRDERAWTLAVTFHHIVSDAWSAQRFVAELVACYRAALAGREPSLSPLPIQYGDFARWQRSDARRAELDRQRAWWRSQLAGAPPSLPLPHDRARPTRGSHAGDSLRFGVDRRTTHALRRLAAEREGTTLYMVLLSGLSVLLHRLSGETDLCVGTAIAGRGRPETEALIGLFVNTLVLRVDVSGEPSFRQLLDRARTTALGAFAHPDLPFEQLVEALSVARDPSIHPLFQVLLLLQNVPATDHALKGLDLKLTPRASSHRRARFDLTVAWLEGDDGLTGHAEFSTDLFDHATIERWCAAYVTLLGAAARDPDAPIAALPLGLAPSIRGGEPMARAETASVAQRFTAVASRKPDAVAVGFEGHWWTYRELDARADRLARALVARGVAPETRLGLAAERGPTEWLGMLAAWKAGAAYVPLDPAFPADRLAWILASSRVDLVLISGAGAALALPDGVDTLSLDAWLCADMEPRPAMPAALPDADADRLAYVLYTSGSTGRPKGVGVSHGSALFFLDAMIARLGFRRDVRLLAVTTLGFDISLLERWGPLLVGGSSQVVSAAEAADGDALGRRLSSSGANVLQGTPATWRLLRDARWAGDPALTALVGGEALPMELAGWIAERTGALWNLYGPTETTVWSTAHRFPRTAERGKAAADATASVELGEPLGATRLSVVDAQLRPVPIGVWGELIIAGPGVARGYEGRAAETARRFVPDPWGAPGARAYRSGDLCRMRENGALEFGGRRDGQVKIRGFRIETAEIEARLCESPAVAASAVVAVEQALVAFVVPANAAAHGEGGDNGAGPPTLDAASLSAELARALPAYMVPRRIALRPALPLTPGGKLDRRALCEEARATRTPRGEHLEPRSPTEAILAGIFAEVLGLARVSVEADFFELGGHSLLATRVASRMRERLGKDLPLRAIFEAPTVAALARRVEALPGPEDGGAPLVAIPAAQRPASIPASHAQERLWFLDQLTPGDPAYAIPLLLRLEGPLDVDALARALRDVVRRHEVLRTTFAEVKGRPEQRIHGPDSALAQRAAAITEIDLTSLRGPAQVEATRDHALSAARTAFDLRAGPLSRTLLLRVGERSHLALLVMHHIVSDGWSVSVLARELIALYEAHRAGAPSPLSPLPIQYADWAIHERAALAFGALAPGLSYWTTALAGVPGELTLPEPRERPETRAIVRDAALAVAARGKPAGDAPGAGRARALSGEARRDRDAGPRLAARRAVTLDAERVAGARALARAQDATLFMVLLAAYGAALRAEGGGDDLVVGCPSAGREDPRIEPSIGFFVNTLPMRLRVSGERTFRQLVDDVRATTLSGLVHRRVPFARIAEAASRGGRAPRSLGQLWFVLQNVPRPSLSAAELVIEPLAADEISRLTGGLLPARYDLKLELQDAAPDPGFPVDAGAPGALTGGFEYCIERFDVATIDRLAARFVELVGAMARTPDQRFETWLRSADQRAAGELAERRQRGLSGLRARPVRRG